MNNKQIKEQTYKVIAIVFYLIYGISCFVLYYRQSIGFGGKYDSDLMLHIQSGISAKNSYSLSTNLLGILYRITDDTKLVAAFLTLGSLITVAGVYWMFQYLLKRKNIEISSGGLQLCSLLCCFVMSIYVPFFYEHFYLGTITGQAWHNSTYIQMRALGIFIMILYFKMEEEYLEHLSKTQMFLFCVGLIIINMIKPNFIIAFAPMMAIYLCVDLVTSKVPMKKKFKQIILFGSCVLPSLAVLFFQNKMLFPEDSESGMVIKIGYSFMRTGNPYAKIILGLAFPILILVFNCKELVRDRVYGSAWLMWLISFLEYFIFAETGKRQTHGNLAWGMLFGTFFLFIISIYKFICNRYSKSNNKIYYRMGYVLLACHAFSGIFYFIKLLLGGSYGV